MDNKKPFPALLEDLSRSKDSVGLIKTQRNTLLRYEETNEMLRQFLGLSDSTHKMLLENYTAHSRTLIDLKKDLENSFKRIRTLKVKLKEKYPSAFELTAVAMKELEERYELEDDETYRQQHAILSSEHDNEKLNYETKITEVDKRSLDERKATLINNESGNNDNVSCTADTNSKDNSETIGFSDTLNNDDMSCIADANSKDNSGTTGDSDTINSEDVSETTGDSDTINSEDVLETTGDSDTVNSEDVSETTGSNIVENVLNHGVLSSTDNIR